MKPSLQKAFTLVELLIVIAIVSIMAAMLFPVFQTAREKARAIACLNNTEQLGHAEMLYTQDNDEALWNEPNIAYPSPPPFYSELLMPYIKSAAVFSCPDAPNAGLLGFSGYARPSYKPAYGFADPGVHAVYDPSNPAAAGQPYTLARFDQPAEVALLTDAVLYWNQTICEQDPEKPAGVGSRYFAEGDPHAVFFADILKWVGQPIHQGGMNFVYADGHARFGRVTQIRSTGLYIGYYPSARALTDDCTQFGQ